MDVEVTMSTELELDIAARNGKVAGHSTGRRVLVISSNRLMTVKALKEASCKWQEKLSSFRPVPVQQCAPSSSSGQTSRLGGSRMLGTRANGLSRRSSRHCVR